MATIREELIHGNVEQQHQTAERAAATAALLIALLDSTEAQVHAVVDSFLETYGTGADISSPAVQAAIDSMKADVAAARAPGWARVLSQVRTESTAFIDIVLTKLTALYQKVTGLGTKPVVNSENIINTPFLGRDLATWIEDLAGSDAKKIADQVMVGVIRGAKRRDILKAILGSQNLDGADGVTNVTRRQLNSIIDVATFSVAAQAKADWAEENVDNFPQELYVAVLDSRTTEICRSLNGNVYKVGEGPVPPLHWFCRSTRIPLPSEA